MKSRASLDLSCIDATAARSLLAVLTPDNEGGPRGLSISLRSEQRRLRVQIEAESPSTVVSTCLAFLRDITLFQEVWLLSHGKRGWHSHA